MIRCKLKLSINMSKTNFMIIKAIRKKDMPVNIQIRIILSIYG